ncbi:MAG: MFS transporter [Lewinella sp.]|nr:MFS transporter [Lewinella sp.]
MLSRWAVSLIFAINGFLYANWVARLPRLQEDFGMDHGDLGMVLLSSSIGALVAMPLTGRIIVRTGSRRLTTVMLFVFVALHPLLPLMPGYGALLAVFFLLGLSSGSLDVAMNAQAVLVEQVNRKPIMASFHAIFSAGMVLGSLTGAGFASLGLGLPPHLLIAATLCLAAAVWATRHLITDHRTASATQEPVERATFRPELVLLGLIAFCSMLGEGAMADWSTNYLEKVAGANRYWAPIGLGAFATAMTAGRFLGDYARLRFGDQRLLRSSAVLAAGGLGLALAWPAPPVVAIGFFLVGAGLATVVPIAYSVAGSLPGMAPGVGISMVTTIGYAGFLLGPPIIGFLGDWQGLRVGMSFVFFLFLLMLGLNVWGQSLLYRRRARVQDVKSDSFAGL